MKKKKPLQHVNSTRIKKQLEQKQRNEPKTLEAKTYNHKEYIRSIIENDITICTGPAGSGKSFIPAGLFAQYLMEGRHEQIIATRPLVCSGKDIGSLPGEMGDKIAPYLKPIEENFKYFFGFSNYGQFLNDKKIRYEPLEVMRGATFNNSLMILDEAQNCTVDQIKMFITRMGKDSKIVINGDIKQTDISNHNGLNIVIEKLRNIEGLGICTLTYEDIQRNGIIGKVLKALEE
jgi:phosphate starvation-inducible protein PhoH and related proteins